MAQRKVNCEVYTDRGIVGKEGKSAYQQAVEGGYQGTEEEFEQALASDIATVANNVTNINVVGNNIENVNTAVDNMAAIIAAPTAATQAAASASQADTSATNAQTSETNAATSASNAAESAYNASTSATTATTKASEAMSSATSASAFATSASESATSASTSATNAQIWAEGIDAQVTTLGGEHSSKGWANVSKQYAESIGAALKYKGSVSTYSALPSTGQEIGDTWNVLDTGDNYAWTGTEWDKLSGTVDLSAYRTSADQDLIDDTLATKAELAGYLPLTGGTINGELKVVGPLSEISTFSGNESSGYTRLELKAKDTNRAEIRLANKKGQTQIYQIGGSTEIYNTLYNKRFLISSILTFDNNKVLDASDKAVANGVASLDANAKVPAAQIPVATTSALGGVKVDGTTITATADGVISATGGSGSGFDFEGTKAEFDAAVAAGTITEDSVSLITDDVSGDTVVTKADLAVALNERADKQLSNTNLITNCILSAPNGVVQVSSTDPYTLVVNKGLKVALSNGYNADRTPKSEIITLDNDISITIPSTTNYNWPIYVILAKPISDGAFRILVPNKSDFASVKVIPSNIQTDLYKVYYNLDTNTFYEHQIDGSLSEYKGVLLGFGKFVDSKFTDMIPYKPIQLSLEGLGDYVVEFQVNSDGSWYRKYKSGWLEQGGVVTARGEVTLLKPFANTAYSVQATSLYTNYTNWGFGVNKTSVSSFHLYMNTGTQGAMWEAKGQGA